MTPRQSMAAFFAVSILAPALSAQWSASTSTHLAVADGGNTQTAEFIVPTSDGGCYVGWYEALTPLPGAPSDFRVQRLDAGGREVWPHGGTAITTGRATLGVDANDDALVLYSVNNAGVNHFSVAKLDRADGQHLWQTAGVFVGTTTANLAFESVTGTSDGEVVVSWISNDRSQVIVRRYDTAGFIQWTATIVPTLVGSRTLGATLMPGPNGSVFCALAYFAGPSVSSPILLRAQKIDSSGVDLWPNDQVTVSDSDSAIAWEMEHDGVGGLVIAWATNTETSAQRISSAGAPLFAIGGVEVSTDLASARSSMEMRFDPNSLETMVVFRERNATNDGVSMQRFDATGARLEGATGQVLVPMSSQSILSVHVADVHQGILATWNETLPSSSEQVRGVVLDATGATLVPDFPIATGTSNKELTPLVSSTFGHAMFAFTDDATGDDDVLAQNVLVDGTLGGLASVTARNGSGVNPSIFTSSTEPRMGTDWVLQIAQGPTDVATGFVLHTAPDPGSTAPGFGEVLVDLSLPTLIGQSTFGAGPPHVYTIPIPSQPGLIGLAFHAQGIVAAQNLTMQLTNALDLVVGL